MYSEYLRKHAFRPNYFHDLPDSSLGLVVVIPAHNENSLITALESLHLCKKPKGSVEIIVVFNASDTDQSEVIQENKTTSAALKEWFKLLNEPWFKLLIIEENNLPPKHAGVGLARKIGMDEAVRRFQLINSDGIVVCYDADSRCLSNYLCEIEKHFEFNSSTEACSIHFEHPLEGLEFDSKVYNGITYYELHLRYYKNGLDFAGLPFAFHTIGSSMAVRASAYCKEGGMNKRKAGEDFYFLQKFISIGKLTELNSTKVIPSPRSSNRVPFGTGRAILEMLQGDRAIELSYAFETFETLKDCFAEVPKWYDQSPNCNKFLIEFIGEEVFTNKIEEIRSQSTNRERFVKRFFQWFNAFQTLKFVHFLRDYYFPMKPLQTEAVLLLNRIGNTHPENLNLQSLLKEYRNLDRL